MASCGVLAAFAVSAIGTASSTLGAGLALSGVAQQRNQNGFIGGGQVGYNYQWGQSFVIGLEADMQGTGIRGTSRRCGIGADSALSLATL